MTYRAGWRRLRLLWILAGLILVGGGVWTVLQLQQSRITGENQWAFNGERWYPQGMPPKCADPLRFPAPVDVKAATAILYPGQTRGGDYKPHGGFVFGSAADNNVVVKAPMDAMLIKGSRYIEQGETQYLLVFLNPCGILYRFDHLLELSPAMQEAMAQLPSPRENDSRTTDVVPPVEVKTGEVVATRVGFASLQRATVDFGVYDLRQKNAVSQDSAWREAHSNQEELGHYGVCWLENLVEPDRTTARALPGGDSQAGKKSDYCT